MTERGSLTRVWLASLVTHLRRESPPGRPMSWLCRAPISVPLPRQSSRYPAANEPRPDYASTHELVSKQQRVRSRGVGAVPLYNLMEDAATAEISRSQVWQWLHWNVALDDGRPVTRELVEHVIADEMEVIAAEVGGDRISGGHFDEARDLFAGLVFAEEFPQFS